MSIAVGRTYTDFSIPEETRKFEFPDTMTGSVRPGSLDEFYLLSYVKWGSNMLNAIEPNTIPLHVGVLLDESYKHLIDDSIINPASPLYIHESNAHLGPTNRSFWVWRRDRPFKPKEFNGTPDVAHPGSSAGRSLPSCTDLIHETPCCRSLCFDFVPGGPIYVANVSLKPKPAITVSTVTLKSKPTITVPTVTLEPDLIKTVLAQFAELKVQFASLQTQVSELVDTVALMTMGEVD